MIYVGIDVAKDKHDCFICNGDGEVLANVFTIENSKSGFEHLLSIINTCTGVDGKKKVGPYDGREKEKRADAGLWLLLVCVNMTAGICSSIAVFLVSILMALAAFALMIAERDFKVLIRLGAVCIPNLVYMGIYVVMAYSYLLH